MTVCLIRKEFRQHWLALLLVTCMSLIGMPLILMFGAQGEVGSSFEAVRTFLITLLPLGMLVACNRLVVDEYRGKTQLFLETLPVTRRQMITVKYGLGLAFAFLVVTAALLIALVYSLRSEVPAGRFLAIIASRAYVYGWCGYAFFFMMGLMGRYRIALYVLALLGIMALDTQTTFELGRFGPFALVDARFGFERFEYPATALWQTVSIGAVLSVMTIGLSLTREGSIAATLSEKMTHREKITITVFILTLTIGIALFDERVKKKRFELIDARTVVRGEVKVQVSAAGKSEKQELDLATWVADEVSAMQAYLALEDPPPIFIQQWGQLDSYHFEKCDMEDADGLLVRANFANADWQDRRFLPWLLRELLLVWSNNRLESEPNRWVLDGFPEFWCARHKDRSFTYQEQLQLRAAYGRQSGFSAADVERWLSFEDRVGTDIATSVACCGLQALHHNRGEDRCREFLKVALDCNIPDDIRGTLHEWRYPLSRLLEQHAQVSFTELASLWSTKLDEFVGRHQRRLAGVPRVQGDVWFEAVSDYTHVAHYRVRSEPPPARGRYSFLHAELPPLDVRVEPSLIRREYSIYSGSGSEELSGTLARGTRLLSTFVIWSEALGCEVISGWTRAEVR